MKVYVICSLFIVAAALSHAACGGSVPGVAQSSANDSTAIPCNGSAPGGDFAPLDQTKEDCAQPNSLCKYIPKGGGSGVFYCNDSQGNYVQPEITATHTPVCAVPCTSSDCSNYYIDTSTQQCPSTSTLCALLQSDGTMNNACQDKKHPQNWVMPTAGSATASGQTGGMPPGGASSAAPCPNNTMPNLLDDGGVDPSYVSTDGTCPDSSDTACSLVDSFGVYNGGQPYGVCIDSTDAEVQVSSTGGASSQGGAGGCTGIDNTGAGCPAGSSPGTGS